MVAPGDHVHFVAIGGAGMSAIARVLLQMGCRVSGSDVELTDVTDNLAALGATIYPGHRAEQVDGADLVVYSTATADQNPEVEAARKLGIPTWHRSEMLAELLNHGRGIAVAGSNGKTTVTAMLAWALVHSGLDPTYLIGGDVPGLGASSWGTGQYLVAETDESDRSFLRYRPAVAIVTSIEPDHLEYYDGQFERMVDAFEQFLRNLKADGLAILGVDDSRVAQLADRVNCRQLTYGIHRGELRATEIRQAGFQTHFTVRRGSQALGPMALKVPGRYNVQNALAATGAALEAGAPFGAIAEALANFGGARRRFQVLGEAGGVMVVDDYAHNPAKVKAVINAVREGWPNRRVIAVFQPHRYSRTHYLIHEFAAAFSQAHRIILTDVYAPPPEKPIEGATGQRLFELTREREGDRVVYCPDFSQVIETAAALAQPGDIILTMGAGNIWRAAREILVRLRG